MAASPEDTHDARSSHALHEHDLPHNAVARGLEVSLRDVLQHKLLKAQVRYDALQLRILLLKLLQPPRLVDLQPAILLAPPVVRLVRDRRFLTSQRSRLPIRDRHFNLTKQIHHLLRTMLLPSCHKALLCSQFPSTPLAQKNPGTPH